MKPNPSLSKRIIFKIENWSDEKKVQKDENIKTNKNNFLSNQMNFKAIQGSSKSTQASNFDKDFYTKKENLEEYLKEQYPKFFENFELIEYIGKGSTGIVYEGKLHNNKKKQKFAIKFKINQDKKENSKETQEISILRKLYNKNLIEIFAFIKINDYSHFSVLELGNHGDTENFQKVLLKRKVLSETIICYFTKQILEALEYIHKCKIIHMDIKQGNILVDSNLNIKLTDFSVSCSFASFHPEDLVKFPFVGTSKYMSPEIINRTHMKIKEASKIDIYSLGVTLYDLAFGEYPYKLKEVGSRDYDNILKNIQKEKLEFPEDRKVSELFKNFLGGLLEKDYTKRFNIAKALNHPWIKAAQIIYNEKENAYCNENFLINLITDNIRKFNNYLKSREN
jgi:serine/threonine protein kinase